MSSKKEKDFSDKSSTRSGSKKRKAEPKKEEDSFIVPGWISLKPLSDQQMDKEINTTLAGMLPFRAPALNPQRVLVDTVAGLRDGHGAQEHVVRDFDTRFMKTSTGSPLFTAGIFLKPPTLPIDAVDPARDRRKKDATEEEFKKRGLDAVAGDAAGEDGDGHLAMELAQFTFNKFDLSRQASRRDKASEVQSLKGVDPSRIHQLLAHNIRSQAPAPVAEPVAAIRRSNVRESKKNPRPLDVKPNQVLPSSPVQHYFSLPGREDPIAPYSFVADRLDDIYQPLPFVLVAKGNFGDNSVEAPLVLNPSPPETHLHIPGKESSYFSVPATPPTLSLGAPRENPQEKLRRATHKEIATRPIPLAPSTPPEASFFVPTREIPAMPRTHEPKTAGFGSFVATPVQEKLLNEVIKRHRGGDGSSAFPPMLLPRTPAELNFEAPPGSELSKKLGNDKTAQRDDMFSLPATSLDHHKSHDKISAHKEAELGARPKPVLPRTPAETKLTLPMRDSTGAQIPPAGQFFSVPATPPDSVLGQLPVPNTVRSRRQEGANEVEFDQNAVQKVAQLLDEADQASRENGNGPLSPEKREETERELYESIYRNRAPHRVDFGADDAPHVHLPPTPPETKSLLPTFTVTNTLTNKLMMTTLNSRSTSTSSSSVFNNNNNHLQKQQQSNNVSVLANVFGTPATPINAPIQPDLVDYHQKNPLPVEPKPILPPTPLENHFTMPILDREGTENDTNQSINFSIPPTPPGAPLVIVPPIQKKIPNEGQPDVSKAILPPTPVEPRLEPLPPTKGIDMEHEVANAKKAQVFSLPATPPDSRLPQVLRAVSKFVEKEEKSAAQDRADNESLVSNQSLMSDLPPALKIQMREMREQEKKFIREEKETNDKREGARPVLPHTPPELSYSLPPKFEIKRGNINNDEISRSGSAASSVFTSISQRPSRSESEAFNISVTSPSGKTVPKLGDDDNNNNKNKNEKSALSGEFFSVPATPPGGNKPLVTIIRKQAQSDVRGVIDSKPVIPSTPPDDFFSLPPKNNNNNNKVFSSVIHFPPSSPGGTGGGILSPQQQNNNTSNKKVVQEENRFFSLNATPPSASAPLVLNNKEEILLPLSPSAKKQQAEDKFLLTGASPAEQEQRKQSLSDNPPKLPTPQELSWGVPGIPDSPAKKGYDPKQDAAARQRHEKYIEEFESRKLADADAAEKRKLELEMRALEAQNRKLQQEAEAQKRHLTPDEAAIKIQSLQRQRIARVQVGQLRENKIRAEKLKEIELQQAKLEAELKQLEMDEQNSAATKIQTVQRQRAAKRELERLKQEKAREHEEAENEKKIAALEDEIDALEKRQQYLTDKAAKERRPLTDVEEATRVECAQKEKAAKEQLQSLKQVEATRQVAVAEKSKQSIDILEKEKKARQAELVAAVKDGDSEKAQALGNEIENLEKEIECSNKEHAAFVAEAQATKADVACSQLKMEIEAKEKELASLKSSFAGRPVTEVEKRKEADLEQLIHDLKLKLEEKQDERSEADEEWRNQEAVAESSRAQDQVSKLEDEVKRLQDEERSLEETARGRQLTDDEAARKIQCLQRQRLAKQELERRKQVAEARDKEVQRTKLEVEMGILRRHEELFVEKERDGIPLTLQENRTREHNNARLKQLQDQLRVLNYVRIQIDPKSSIPSTPPSQRGLLPTQLPQSLSKLQSSLPPSTSAITSNNLAGPLPPTPPELTHGLPIPSSGFPSRKSSEAGQQEHSISYFQQLPLDASLPAGNPEKPLRSQIHRHSGSDSPRGMNPVLPRTPPDQSGLVLPGSGKLQVRKDEQNLAEVLEQHDAATKIQSVQRQRIARQELAKKRQEAADKATKEEEIAAEKLRQLEEEQRKLEETAKGRELTPDEAAKKIQCLQRQRIARKELEQRRAITASRKAEVDAANAQDEQADAEDKLRQLEEEQKAFDSIARTRALTEDEAARKIQCLQRQHVAKRELERRKKIAASKQTEANARKADEDAVDAEEKLRLLEEEQRKLDETAKSRALTPDEAARKIQCLQRQRLAKKELERRRQIAVAKQAEVEAVKAQEQQADAEEKLRQLEEEQKTLEETTNGRELTPDEAARKIQCVQRQHAAKKELERRRKIAASKLAEANARKSEEEAADAEDQLRLLEDEHRKLEEASKSRALTPDEAARKIQCLERQRIARQELERRRHIAAARQAEANARKADEEASDAEDKLSQLEDEERSLEETARRRELTPDEAARKIQCLQRQHVAKQELERRKQIAADKQREAERIAALPIPGSDPRAAMLDFSNIASPPGQHNDPESEAQRIARRAVRDAAEESDRRFLRDDDGDDDERNANSFPNNRSSGSTRTFVVPPNDDDDTRSLPGLDTGDHHHHHPGERRLSNASSNLQGPSNRPETNISNNNNNGIIPGPTTPVIIRRGGSSNNNSANATPGNQHLGNNNTNNNSLFRIDPNATHSYAVEESPAPRPLQHGHVMRNVADSMPHAETLHQFAAHLEVYFSTFDPSQMENIRSIAPAYRNRQRDLWDFLKDRYETGANSVYNNNNNNNSKNRNTIPPPPASTVSASPSIRIPASTTTMTNNINFTNSQHLPQLTPAMQRLIQQHHRDPVESVNESIINRTVTASQIPNATSSRIILHGENNNTSSNAVSVTTPIRTNNNQQSTPTSTTSNISAIQREPVNISASANANVNSSINNSNNRNNTSAVSFVSPSPITIIRRTGSGNHLNASNTSDNNNNNNNSKNASTTSAIGEDIVASDRHPSSLVEDLAMSEILKMLRDKK